MLRSLAGHALSSEQQCHPAWQVVGSDPEVRAYSSGAGEQPGLAFLRPHGRESLTAGPTQIHLRFLS